MRKALYVGIIFIMIFSLTACMDNASKESSDLGGKKTAFLDLVNESEYLEDDRKAINSLCEAYKSQTQGELSKKEYNRLERKFLKDLDGYDTRLALVTKYESFLYGYLRNFSKGSIDETGIDEMYQVTKQELLKTETKREFYDVCVDFEKGLKDEFQIDITPSTDIRLYMEERNLDGGFIFDDDTSVISIDNEDEVWPVGGVYVDYNGQVYETKEDAEIAVDAGVTDGYYYLYEDGTVDSPVPITDKILNNYKRKQR